MIPAMHQAEAVTGQREAGVEAAGVVEAAGGVEAARQAGAGGVEEQVQRAKVSSYLSIPICSIYVYALKISWVVHSVARGCSCCSSPACLHPSYYSICLCTQTAFTCQCRTEETPISQKNGQFCNLASVPMMYDTQDNIASWVCYMSMFWSCTGTTDRARRM